MAYGPFFFFGLVLFMIILSIGYILIPFDIKSSIKTLTNNDYVLNEPNITLCIQGFLQTLPTTYPTIEKHVIQLANSATSVEREQCTTLSLALGQLGQPVYGVMQLENNRQCILSQTSQNDIFTLHVIKVDQKPENSSIQEDKMPDLEGSVRPAEILRTCQLWPNSQPQLAALANQIYKAALLYGYWDNWRVFENICQRYQIDVQQFI